MDCKIEKIKKAKKLFYNKEYKKALKLFMEGNCTYEAALCFLLLKNLKSAYKFFKLKENICPASNFGLLIIDIIENKPKHHIGYFQVRSFLELFLNLLIENEIFDWAQKIINEYNFFTQINPESPKFIARVLYANGYFNSIHTFSQMAKNICSKDAEIYFIEACVYLEENNIEEAKNCVDTCISFAPEYYPILKLYENINSNKTIF